ncbi:exosome non-catalytic core subunit rrp46 [Ophidiomyces ophidiicola]|nr:exosome non-catalytic core subunit rrp46 [Ophidiomyces ophidiicola]KAI1983641.1 exosome non-catalytic core subunit rrp46 [Ophidiomyces ophidiicola]KAI1989354.1 exosome non-catalytic core subunit rrp46 [Ophidiomyces ophidiicola]
MAPLTAQLSPLRFANGSAAYTSPAGHRVLAAVNGPVDPARRDTLKPDEATLDILVKPAAGASSVGERYAESIIRGLLARVVLLRDPALARRAVVVTLVVEANPAAPGRVDLRGASYLPVLPALLHAALLALVSAAVPMSMMYSAVLVAVDDRAGDGGSVRPDPTPAATQAAASLHVLAFSSQGHLLLSESHGACDWPTWERVHDCAQAVCRGGPAGGGVEGCLREAAEQHARHALSWTLATP